MNLKRYEMSGKENIYAFMNLFMPYLSVDLKEKIDKAAMQRATIKALEYHPLFATKIVFDNGLFYYEENPNPPVIFNLNNAPKIFGTKDNNFYPWLIVVQDNQVFFYSTHMLTDGSGILNFSKTVLHLYFEEVGVMFEDKTNDFPNGTPNMTIENSYLKYACNDYVSVGTPSFAPPTNVNSNLVHLDTSTAWKLIIPKKDIHRFATESETSVFSVIACILARSMANAFDINSGNIFVRVPVSLRGLFPSITDRNFIQGFSLCYSADKMNTMPDALVETAFRSQLDIWIEKGNLTSVINEDVDTVKRLKAGPEEMNTILGYGGALNYSANIFYTHITRPNYSKELMSRIADITLANNTAPTNLVSVLGVTIDTDINLTILECSKDSCYMDAMKKVLSSRDISFELKEYKVAADFTYQDTKTLIK